MGDALSRLVHQLLHPLERHLLLQLLEDLIAHLEPVHDGRLYLGKLDSVDLTSVSSRS